MEKKKMEIEKEDVGKWPKRIPADPNKKLFSESRAAFNLRYSDSPVPPQKAKRHEAIRKAARDFADTLVENLQNSEKVNLVFGHIEDAIRTADTLVV